MLYICPICNKNKDGVQNEYYWDAAAKEYKYKHKWKFNKRPCKTCREVMKEAVVLTCSGCDSMTMANEELFIKKGLNVRNGDIFEIHSCPKCAPDKKFHFFEPK